MWKSGRKRCMAAVASAAICAITFSIAQPAAGDIIEVDVGPGVVFSPADVTINVGDTVRWTWVSGVHNVESGVGGTHDGAFRSGDPVATPSMFEFTFDQAFLDANPRKGNLYDYYCALHESFGMVGTVTIEEPVCPADLTDDGTNDQPDGTVNLFDLLLLLDNWGTNGAGADISSEGGGAAVVDLFDLLDMLDAWGGC